MLSLAQSSFDKEASSRQIRKGLYRNIYDRIRRELFIIFFRMLDESRTHRYYENKL